MKNYKLSTLTQPEAFKRVLEVIRNPDNKPQHLDAILRLILNYRELFEWERETTNYFLFLVNEFELLHEKLIMNYES